MTISHLTFFSQLWKYLWIARHKVELYNSKKKCQNCERTCCNHIFYFPWLEKPTKQKKNPQRKQNCYINRIQRKNSRVVFVSHHSVFFTPKRKVRNAHLYLLILSLYFAVLTFCDVNIELRMGNQNSEYICWKVFYLFFFTTLKETELHVYISQFSVYILHFWLFFWIARIKVRIVT